MAMVEMMIHDGDDNGTFAFGVARHLLLLLNQNLLILWPTFSVCKEYQTCNSKHY